jgi:hypothetical protein
MAVKNPETTQLPQPDWGSRGTQPKGDPGPKPKANKGPVAVKPTTTATKSDS